MATEISALHHVSRRDGCSDQPRTGRVAIISHNAASWASLPLEVRQMILSLVGFPIYGRRYSGLDSPKVARFATVCWEWQVFFETCTFQRLVLDPDSLGKFDAIVRRHDTLLGYIRKI